MIIGNESRRLLLLLLAIQLRVNSVIGLCEHSFIDQNKLYNFSLASPLPRFPHGVLSEDGFYKVMVNETVLWFQLCDGMIFNHDPPRCVECSDCGGPSRCGMECSALVSKNAGGYQVCTTIGRVSSTNVSVIDEQNPYKGVIVRMSSSGKEHNCSLSVSIICDSTGVQGPDSMEILGTCDYATVLRHPSGCATIISFHERGFGWFGTLMIIIVCFFTAYLLAGTVYRFFFLGVRGIEAIPNFDFWASLPYRTRVHLLSGDISQFLVQRSIEWGGEHGGNCYSETTLIEDPDYWGSESKKNYAGYRKDAHTSIYKKQWSPLTPEQLANPVSYADCVHWCLPGLQDT